jgi:PAS domain S-box-containing protein
MENFSRADVDIVLSALAEAITDLVFFKNPAGAYLYVNHAFERLYGYTLEQIKGKTDYSFLNQGEADIFAARDREALAAGKKTVSEAWQLNELTDQNECYETIKVPVYANDGQLIGLLGVVRNVTSLRLAEAVLRQSDPHSVNGAD